MKQLLFLGSGSAFTVGNDNYQSNILIMDENKNRLLIDCGSDIRFSLYDLEMSYKEITDIYISHLHADHVGGLEYIAFGRKFDPHCTNPTLYLSKDVAQELWENSLSAGLRSVQNDLMTIDDYFNVQLISQTKSSFQWQGIHFELVKVTHIDNGFYVMPCYGLFFQINGINVFFTGDTQLCLLQLQSYYEKADIIFQDCELSVTPTTVHATFEELKKLPLEIKNKMWLYGYQPMLLPDYKEHGFLGFVKRAQSFYF
jgi:ribonuclease BN (tRNA processing enzyme)